MNSIAIWPVLHTESKEIIPIELHFNLWRIKKKFWANVPIFFKDRNWKELISRDNFLDIGLKVGKCHEIKKICIYIPGNIIKDNIRDMGSIISADTTVLNSVFNEELNVVATDNPKLKEIINSEKQKLFFIYAIDVKSDIVCSSSEPGTIVEILCNDKCNRDSETYFRIRISSNFVEELTYNFRPISSFYESAFNQTEVIDFRVNEKRNLTPSLLEKIKNHFYFTKIHYLLLRNSEDEFLFSNKQIYSSRELEKDVWQKYIDGHKYKYKYRRILAYHFKEKQQDGKDNITSYNLLAKFKIEKQNYRTIIKYLSIILVVSILIENLSNFIYDECGKDLMKSTFSNDSLSISKGKSPVTITPKSN